MKLDFERLSPNQKLALHFLGFLIGVLLGTIGVFQVLFLAKVIPHGGI